MRVLPSGASRLLVRNEHRFCRCRVTRKTQVPRHFPVLLPTRDEISTSERRGPGPVNHAFIGDHETMTRGGAGQKCNIKRTVSALTASPTPITLGER